MVGLPIILYCLLQLPIARYPMQIAYCLLPLPIAIWLAFIVDMSVLPSLLPLRRAVATAKEKYMELYKNLYFPCTYPCAPTRLYKQLLAPTRSKEHIHTCEHLTMLTQIKGQ